MRKPRARSRILKKLPRAPGGNCAQEGACPRHDRNLVRRRGPHRPEEQDHPPLGQARHPSKRTAGPTDRFHLHLRCSLPEGGQGCSPDHAGLQHRGDELAPRRDRRNRRARCPRHPPGRSSRLALVHAPPRAGQYHHHSAAAEVPRAQPGRERLAVHARQLALQPHLQILRRSRRPLLCGMEQARRSALAHHVHRTAPMGPRVLINGIWYKISVHFIRNAGKSMRKLFHTAAAVAALLALSIAANAAEVGARPPDYAPPPIYVAPPFSWTGFYIGPNLGGAWSQRNLTDTLLGLSLSNVNDKGAFIGGGQLGYNYQFGNFVLGIEADFDGVASTNSPGAGVAGPAFGTQVTNNNRWIATLAGRFGIANDTWLFYGKAGGGWVGSDDLTITNTVTGASITLSNNTTNSGWLVGGGIEWAFAPNWSVKIEYDYLGLSSRTFTVPTGGFLAGDTFTTSNPNVQMVKVGANYLFKYWAGGY